MTVQDVRFDGGVTWPSNGLSEVPFRVYTDPEQYALEQERIFKGESWSYLCLAAEIPNPKAALRTRPGLCSSTPFPRSVSQSANSASGSTASCERMKAASMRRGSW